MEAAEAGVRREGGGEADEAGQRRGGNRGKGGRQRSGTRDGRAQCKRERKDARGSGGQAGEARAHPPCVDVLRRDFGVSSWSEFTE